MATRLGSAARLIHAAEVLRVGRWAIELAQDWQAEEEDGCICVTREDGLGVLLLSHSERAREPVAREELVRLAHAELPGDADVGECHFGDFDGLHASYSADGQRWQRFYLSFGTLLLLITYTVDLAYDGQEDDAVIGMLRSLKARGERWK